MSNQTLSCGRPLCTAHLGCHIPSLQEFQKSACTYSPRNTLVKQQTLLAPLRRHSYQKIKCTGCHSRSTVANMLGCRVYVQLFSTLWGAKDATQRCVCVCVCARARTFKIDVFFSICGCTRSLSVPVKKQLCAHRNAKPRTNPRTAPNRQVARSTPATKNLYSTTTGTAKGAHPTNSGSPSRAATNPNPNKVRWRAATRPAVRSLCCALGRCMPPPTNLCRSICVPHVA